MVNIADERSRLAAQGLDIETREGWDAVQDYTSARGVDMPARGFVLHISVTQDPSDLVSDERLRMRNIERIGQERFGIGFPYNASGFDTGRLYEGQPLTRRGAHTVNDKGTPGYPRNMNYAYRALCLPQMVADDVTDAQIDSAARWAAAQIRAGLARPGARWTGHRDFAWKSCPGDAGYVRLAELNRLTRHYENHGLGTPQVAPPPEEDPEMRIMDCKGRPAVLVGSDGGLRWLRTSADRGAYRALGVPAKLVTPEQYLRVIAVQWDDPIPEPDDPTVKDRLDSIAAKVDQIASA